MQRIATIPAVDDPLYPLGYGFCGLDLDYTLFYSHCPGVQWIDSAAAWLDFSLELQEEAKQAGFRLIFGAVTSKNAIDPIVREFALQFKPLLRKDNPYMYRKSREAGECYLVSLNESLVYVSFETDAEMHQTDYPKNFSSRLFSTIEILPAYVKDRLVKRIAAVYGITETRRMFLVDDSLLNLNMASNAGINAVSAHCFNPVYLASIGRTTDALLDPTYVQPHMARLRAEIRLRVMALIAQLRVERAATLAVAAIDVGSAGSSSPARSDTGSLPDFNVSPLRQFSLYPAAAAIAVDIDPGAVERPSHRLVSDDDVEYVYENAEQQPSFTM